MIIFKIIQWLLGIIGMGMLFKKCGVNPLWSIVPYANDYKLAQCADREDDGWIFALSELAIVVPDVVNGICDINNIVLPQNTEYLSLSYMIGVVIINLVYVCRISSGLCKMFGKSKWWVIGLFLVDELVVFIWGISKKTQPKYIIKEENGAAKVLGEQQQVLSEGLTVNLTDRTVGRLFSRQTLLKDIHMSIMPGKMVLLLGGSGAGKTTFVNALTGYEKANATVFVNGNDVYHDFDRMKYEIGFVPQMDLMRYDDTVINTISDAAKLRLPAGISASKRKKRIEEVLDIFGLAPISKSMVRKLSGGQKKRLSIAAEFISDPSLFILDEPDSGLDGILARDLMQRLHDISRQGKIVIVITHTPDRVIDLFDEVIVLGKDANHSGRLVYHGNIEKAKEFFGRDSMEAIIKMINREEEGGEGKSDELIEAFDKLRAALE